MQINTMTVGIPAYKAQSTLPTLLASLLIQSHKDFSVIIANDWPEDNGSYEFLKTLYPTLDITVLDCEVNTGPGLARQRALDACKTEWITFMDADDVLMSPFALESLYNNITPVCIEVMGTFFQEIQEGNMSSAERMQLTQTGQPVPPRVSPRNDANHPWVFARLYRVSFLRQQDIRFCSLRAIIKSVA